jgi:iron complex transport system substrate-binding protein/vitamin B12 transport system substrate-binding protein
MSTAWAEERILALSPHACEILYAIGAADEVVGVSQYCDYPASFAQKPEVASYSRLFTEAALRLRPSLIIASNASLKGLEKLKHDGSRIMVTHPETLDDIMRDIERLGKFTGHEDQAVAVSRKMKEKLGKIRHDTKQRKRVFFEVWSDPLMTEAGKSFITHVLDAAGGDNVFAGHAVESMRLNVESVIRAAPEVIIIPSRSGDISSRQAFWKHWLPQALVIAVNPDLISRPGPRIVDGIELLQQQLMQKGRY